MKLLLLIKKFFMRHRGCYEVWDTSAVSNYDTEFKSRVQTSSDLTLVLTEGVVHELSAGRRTSAVCRSIYYFINNNIRNPKILTEVTENKIRSWTVDEQVVYTASKYTMKGYETTLITCDKDEAFKAKLKGINVMLLPVKKRQPVTPKQSEKKEPVKFPEDIVAIPCTKLSDKYFLKLDNRYAVYDIKGRRKIGKGDKLQITHNDTVEYNQRLYTVFSLEANRAVLKLA